MFRRHHDDTLEDSYRFQEAREDAREEARRARRHAGESTQRMLDRLTGRDPETVIDRYATRAGDAMSDGLHWMQDLGSEARRRMAYGAGRAAGYVREDPWRSVVVAAAAGAIIYSLVRLVGSRHTR